MGATKINKDSKNEKESNDGKSKDEKTEKTSLVEKPEEDYGQLCSFIIICQPYLDNWYRAVYLNTETERKCSKLWNWTMIEYSE